MMIDIMDRLRECSEYKQYLEQKKRILKFPELKDSIYRIREIYGLIQETEDPETEENLRSEYERLIADGRIHDFMQAELDYCRMFQELEAIMAKELDL
ncbi:MAG: YlbF family regulator, partial [Lachnospiraceae bacterium]|nr:YlbF family regulator [Lachnospiraceae bacterium]